MNPALALRPEQLVQPGHVFPLRARPGGVLERAGHTEAAVDLAVLAGLAPIGVLCELVNDDGTVQRLPQLMEFKARFGLKMISIAALIEYRARRDQLVELVTAQPFASEFGAFTLHVFRSRLDGRHHLALTMGALGPEPALVRVHSENLLSDLFRARGMVGHHLLTGSLAAVAAAGRGVVLYMQPANSDETLVRSLAAKPGDAASAGRSAQGVEKRADMGLTLRSPDLPGALSGLATQLTGALTVEDDGMAVGTVVWRPAPAHGVEPNGGALYGDIWDVGVRVRPRSGRPRPGGPSSR